MNFEGLKHLATSWGGALMNDVLLSTAKDVAGKAAESGGEALAERIKQSLEISRDEVARFIRDELWKKGGEYQRAAENLFDGQKLRQQKALRPYGSRKRFRPRDEDKYMLNLARLYRLFAPGPRPEKPQPLVGGKGGVGAEVLKLLWEKYEEERRAWEESAKEKAEARIEFFKDLGQMDPEELEAYLETVNDDKLKQWLELPFFEMVEAAKASLKVAEKAVKAGWEKIDDGAGKAAPHVGRLADWLESKI